MGKDIPDLETAMANAVLKEEVEAVKDSQKKGVPKVEPADAQKADGPVKQKPEAKSKQQSGRRKKALAAQKALEAEAS